MAVQFQDVNASFSETLNSLIASLREDQVKKETVSVRELLEMVGEQGLLIFCMILTVPFLVPFTIPGVSTVFGALIMLISIGIILNRVPWLPGFLMKRSIKTEGLIRVFEGSAKIFGRVERIVRPRWSAFSANKAVNRFNGIMLFIAGFLLILPLTWLPGSNLFPGYAILFLAAGILQRDGLLIVLGYVLNIATVIYFTAVAIGLLVAGRSVLELFREQTPTPTAP